MKTLTLSDRSELRQFGFVLAGFIVLAFWILLPWLFGHARPQWPLWAGGLMAAAALVLPESILPIYRAWLPVARVIGWFNTRLILGIVFFLVFVPVGFIAARLGKLQYREGFDRNATTYRIDTSRELRGSDLENPF